MGHHPPVLVVLPVSGGRVLAVSSSTFHEPMSSGVPSCLSGPKLHRSYVVSSPCSLTCLYPHGCPHRSAGIASSRSLFHFLASSSSVIAVLSHRTLMPSSSVG